MTWLQATCGATLLIAGMSVWLAFIFDLEGYRKERDTTLVVLGVSALATAVLLVSL